MHVYIQSPGPGFSDLFAVLPKQNERIIRNLSAVLLHEGKEKEKNNNNNFDAMILRS